MEQFEQLLTCAICLDRYRIPKLLPCQHSFCMEPCMEGLVDYVRRQVKCPECRAEHRIPYQGVQGFPTNVTLQRFLELHIEITGELPDPTSGQVMERCNVCSEKSYCSCCQHCDKKICEECKGAHMDILRREIARINNQIRRGIHRLQDALAIVEKNTQNIQTNCLSVSEEVDEIYRRLSKAIKDRTDHLRGELDRYLGTELRTLTSLKDNLEQEVSNILSNCDLADKHMNENVNWDDCELMDTKEIFLKTVDFIRNFEYETSDYSRKVRLILAHDPNQLVLHVSGFGDLNITNANNPFNQSGLLQAQGSSAPGLMRSKSDHRLATQFRQQEERGGGYDRSYGDVATEEPARKFGERGTRTGGSKYDRYGRGGADTTGNEYGEDYDESSRPARSRYRSRLAARHGADDSDTETSTRGVRFNEQQPPQKERERVLDTEDVARGPLSGITRLADSPRVMKKLQEESGAVKKKEKEVVAPPVVQPKVVPKRPPPPAANRQVSEEDEIARIKKQNKGAATSTATADTTETATRPAVTPLKREEPEDRHSTTRKTPAPAEAASSAEESDESVTSLPVSQRKTPAKSTTPRRPSTEPVSKKTNRSASSDSSSSDTSSSAVRSTGAAYTTDEVKQKIISRGNDHSTETPARTRQSSTGSNSSKDATKSAYQSRYGKASTPAQASVTKEEETESSSEEETETESESEDNKPDPKEITKSDIGPLLARSAIARDSSAESTRKTSREEPTQNSTAIRSRYGTTRDDPPSPVSKYTPRTRPSLVHDDEPAPPSRYTSRFLNKSKSSAAVSPTEEEDRPRFGSSASTNNYDDPDKYQTGRSRYMALKERRQRLARSKSSHNFADDDDNIEDTMSPTTANPSAYLASRGYGSAASSGNDLARSRSTHALKSRENSPDRPSAANNNTEKDGAALSSWARYLKNKYGNRTSSKDKENGTGSGGGGSSLGTSASSSSAAARRLSLGLPLRSSTEVGSSDDDSKNMQGSPTTPTAATVAAQAGIAVATAGISPRGVYLQKGQQLFEIGSRGSEPGCFTWPRGVAVGPDNAIVIADSSNHRVQVFEANGKFREEFGAYGSGEGEFDCLAGVAVNRIGQFIIADRYNHRIQVFDPSGRFLRSFGSQGTSDGRFNYPWGITTDALGFIYVCDKENHRVQVFQSDGTFVGKFGSMGNKQGQLEHPHYIAVSNTNRVVVSDCNNHRIQIFDVNGRVISAFGSEGSAEGQFKFPRGIAVDDQGYICVADSGNNRIQIFTPEGTFLKSFGGWGSRPGEFKGLEGVAISSNGYILVCDRENHRIQVF